MHTHQSSENAINTFVTLTVVWKAVHSWTPACLSHLGVFKSHFISLQTLSYSLFSKHGIISHSSVPGPRCFPGPGRTFLLFPAWPPNCPCCPLSEEHLLQTSFRWHCTPPPGSQCGRWLLSLCTPRAGAPPVCVLPHQLPSVETWPRAFVNVGDKNGCIYI